MVVRQTVTDKLNALREGTWNSVHWVHMKIFLAIWKKPFAQQAINLMELPGISPDNSLPEPLNMVMGMFMLMCGVDFPWHSSESHSPPHFQMPLALLKHYSRTDTRNHDVDSHTINKLKYKLCGSTFLYFFQVKLLF